MKTVFEVAMAAKGLTGAKIARLLCVSDPVVSNWKRGHLYVPQKYRSRIAELLGLPIEELFDARGIPKLAEDAEPTLEI